MGTLKFWKCLLCVQLWLKNSNFPLLATSRGRSAASKNSKQKLHTWGKNPRNCYYIFSPVGLVIFVISSVDLGYKKTGCRRRNVLKEDLVAEDKIRKLVSSLWARLPGYGQKRPRYQWVPGYPMVWDMEFSLVCCKFIRRPRYPSLISSLIFSSPRGLQLLVPPPCRG